MHLALVISFLPFLLRAAAVNWAMIPAILWPRKINGFVRCMWCMNWWCLFKNGDEKTSGQPNSSTRKQFTVWWTMIPADLCVTRIYSIEIYGIVFRYKSWKEIWETFQSMNWILKELFQRRGELGGPDRTAEVAALLSKGPNSPLL